MTTCRGSRPLGAETTDSSASAGKSVRARASAPQIAVGKNVEGPRLTEDEQRFLDRWVGRSVDGSTMDLDELLAFRSRHVLPYEEAVIEYGPQSATALYFRKSIEKLDELISLARSPHGVAKEELRSLIKQAGPVSEEQFNTAAAKVLNSEADRRDRGLPPDEDAIIQVHNAAVAWSERCKAELAMLVQTAQTSSTPLDQSLADSIRAAVCSELQKQNVGPPEDPETMPLAIQAANILIERRREELTKTIDDAKQGRVTELELLDVVTAMLGSEEQRGKLTAPKGDETRTMELAQQALTVVFERWKAEVRFLIGNLKVSFSPITYQALCAAIKRLQNVQETRKRLGADTRDELEVMRLIDEVDKVMRKLKGASAGDAI